MQLRSFCAFLSFVLFMLVRSIQCKSLSAYTNPGISNTMDGNEPAEFPGVLMGKGRYPTYGSADDKHRPFRGKRYAPTLSRAFRFILSEEMDDQKTTYPDAAKERAIIGPILIRLG